MIVSRFVLLACIVISAPAESADVIGVTQSGLQHDVVFSEYSALSRSAEMARRLLSPLMALRLQPELACAAQRQREQSIDLAHEKFAVYVPAQMPEHGYALLVYISPFAEANVPARWISALERHGVIFVSAANSGNEASVLDRREPLALLAAHNIVQRYRIDPQRIYIGGFSGGSRVALRLALAYADLFRGALLDAGSDPIGDAQIPLPPAELLHQFQNSTRLVYVTGKEDSVHLDMDSHSRQSMHDWCVFDLDTEVVSHLGHELTDTAAFSRALDLLDKHSPPSPERLAQCRARIEHELDSQLQNVEALLAGGKSDEARALLGKIDLRYGGLAAPRSIDIAQKLFR